MYQKNYSWWRSVFYLICNYKMYIYVNVYTSCWIIANFPLTNDVTVWCCTKYWHTGWFDASFLRHQIIAIYWPNWQCSLLHMWWCRMLWMPTWRSLRWTLLPWRRTWRAGERGLGSIPLSGFIHTVATSPFGLCFRMAPHRPSLPSWALPEEQRHNWPLLEVKPKGKDDVHLPRCF